MKEFDKQRPVQEAVSDGVIEGRNAVIEALRAGQGHRQDLSGQG